MGIASNIYNRLSKALVGLGLVIRTSATSTLTADPTISAGSDEPSGAEPNGSLYLRTNGGLYKRASDAWAQLQGVSSSNTSSAGNGNTGSATTGITVAEATGSGELLTVDIELPALAGTDVIAGAQSADFDVTTWGSITQPDVDRNVQVAFGAGWDGGNVQITGLDQSGAEVTETINTSPGSTVQGVKGFSFITRVKNTGTRTAGSVTVEYGPKLGLKVAGKTANLLSVYEWGSGKLTGKSLSSAGLLDLGSDAPDGSKSYTAVYALSGTYTVTDSGHVHTGPSHTHTISVV